MAQPDVYDDTTAQAGEPDPVRATMILASHAEVADGRLFVTSGGWSTARSAADPFALAIVLELPWNPSSEPAEYVLAIRLTDPHGEPILLRESDGTEAEVALLDYVFTVDPRSDGPVRAIRIPIAVNGRPLPIEAGVYEWRLWVNGSSAWDWSVDFAIAEPAGSPA